MKHFLVLICFFCILVSGCEDTNLELAAQAGLDAVKAATLTDSQVRNLALRASKASDEKHRVAPAGNPYKRRLEQVAGRTFSSDGFTFNIKVYLSNQVNAFAMADGTIRIYSGLMDMMDDDELLFVVGHEMGHVVHKHIKKKIMLAYAASAIRKGVASQENIVGDIARSQLGGLVQALLNAQFSQQEEREADDFGIFFLHEKKRSTPSAVSALKKLAKLGKDHSFLSSHPAPEARAKRLQEQVNSPEKMTRLSLLDRLIQKIKAFF